MNKNSILTVSAVIAIVIGVGAIGTGIFGMSYTYSKAVEEKITTPGDAAIPDTPVRGPFTMLAQADVIRKHTYSATDGQVYSEMPRFIESLDDEGNPVLDENGDPVMVPNKARDIWITSTSLQTVLQFGALAYALSAFALLYGLTSIATGVVFLSLRSKGDA